MQMEIQNDNKNNNMILFSPQNSLNSPSDINLIFNKSNTNTLQNSCISNHEDLKFTTSLHARISNKKKPSKEECKGNKVCFKCQKGYDQINKQIKKDNFKQNCKIESQFLNKSIYSNRSQRKGIYKDIQMMKKVSTFIHNLKQKALSNKDFTQTQKMYFQSLKSDNLKDSYLLSWQNPIINLFSSIFLLIILIAIWSNTYQLALGIQPAFIWFKSFTLVFYLAWIIIKLNSQLKTELCVISKRKQIILECLKNDLILQLIAIFFLMIQIIDISVLFYPSRIIFLTSIFTYNRLMLKIQNAYSQSSQLEKILIIFRLVLKVLIYLHFLSLLLVLMGELQTISGINRTWITENCQLPDSKLQKYILGYYWAATTMSTVGYGDISPVNIYQKAILSFVQVFCCLFFGYCVNIIGNTIGLLGESSQKYRKQTRKLNRYLKTLDISNNTKNDIKQYLHNRHKIQLTYDQQNQKDILNAMDQHLKKKINQENNRKIIQNSKYLSKFSQETKSRLAELMKKKIFAPKQTLFNLNSNNIKLFLVDTGKVKQYCSFSQEALEKPIAEYDKNDNTIGYYNLITGKKYQSTAKADNYVFAYEIQRDQFLKVLKKNQDDYLIMSQVRQSIIQSKSKFKKGCFVCDRLTHNVIQCPRIHFIPRHVTTLIEIRKKEEQTNERKQNYNKRTLKKLKIQYLKLQDSENFSLAKTPTRSLRSIPFLQDHNYNQLHQDEIHQSYPIKIRGQKKPSWVKFNFNQSATNVNFNTSPGNLHTLTSTNKAMKTLSTVNKEIKLQQNSLKKQQIKINIQQYDKVMIHQKLGFFLAYNLKNIIKKLKKITLKEQKNKTTTNIQKDKDGGSSQTIQKMSLSDKIKQHFSLNSVSGKSMSSSSNFKISPAFKNLRFRNNEKDFDQNNNDYNDMINDYDESYINQRNNIKKQIEKNVGQYQNDDQYDNNNNNDYNYDQNKNDDKHEENDQNQNQNQNEQKKNKFKNNHKKYKYQLKRKRSKNVIISSLNKDNNIKTIQNNNNINKNSYSYSLSQSFNL